MVGKLLIILFQSISVKIKFTDYKLSKMINFGNRVYFNDNIAQRLITHVTAPDFRF